MADETTRCPFCDEQILAVARKCKHGGEILDEALRAERAGAAPRDLGADPALRLILPVGRSIFAVIAGYLGLFSVLGVFAPFALLCGVLAIVEMRRHPDRHGMGRAIFGIVMGGVFTLLFGAVLISAALGK